MLNYKLETPPVIHFLRCFFEKQIKNNNNKTMVHEITINFTLKNAYDH
jgi:hypothetical protein